MTYISRANGQSVMAACAYYDGEQKYSEYDHQWKYPHSQPERVVLHEVMASLEQKDIITVFPEQSVYNKTVLVMKTPKTATSVRKVFLPKTVAEMLVAWKMKQDLVTPFEIRSKAA